MKSALAFSIAAGMVLLSACSQSSPAGAAGGTASGESAGDDSALSREKALRTDQSVRAGSTVPAAAVIFEVLHTKLPPDLDLQLARSGTAALRGKPDERVLLAMNLAARPMSGWAVDPLDDDQAARRWAGALVGSVVVANKAATAIAAELTSAVTADVGELETRVLAAFERLDHQKLAKELDEVAASRVVLDVADASSVRLALGDGASLVLDANGATLAMRGAVRFSSSAGLLDGSSYQLAQDMTRQAAMVRSRTQTSTAGANRSTTTSAAAGVR
jgi:hypothetical protein